jgi:hypothetical protein
MRLIEPESARSHVDLSPRISFDLLHDSLTVPLIAWRVQDGYKAPPDVGGFSESGDPAILESGRMIRRVVSTMSFQIEFEL